MNTADTNRRIENLLRLGTIAEVDFAAKQIRVQSGELLTNWLPWPCEIGRNFTRWRPLRVGAQVILGCVSGEPEQAVILGMLYSSALDAPSTNEAIDLIQFDDSSYINHNSSDNTTHLHSIGQLSLSSDAPITITTTQPISVNGENVDITGSSEVTIKSQQITLSGSVSIAGAVSQRGGDMTSGGISVQKHTHAGVKAGSSTTTGPQ